MSLFHGTSASAALNILSSNDITPSKDGFLYCFNSEKPESMAGALCFATGGTLRNGCIDTKDLLSHYNNLNPAFPKGLKGAFVKMGLKMAISSWTKTQQILAQPPYPDQSAIVVFQSHTDAINISRGGFINEVRVPSSAFETLVVEKAYFDDSLLNAPEVLKLKENGIAIEPLSAWAKQVNQQALDLKTAKANKKKDNGPSL